MSAAKFGFIVGGTTAVLAGTVLVGIHPALGLASGLIAATLPLWSRTTSLALDALSFPSGDRLEAANRALYASRLFGFFAQFRDPGTGRIPVPLKQEPHALGWKITIRSTNPIEVFERYAPNIAGVFGALSVRISKGGRVGTYEIVGVTKNPIRDSRNSRLSFRSTSSPKGTGNMVITVGRIENGEDLELDLAEAVHTAVQGVSRSGKSMFATQLVGAALTLPNVRVTGIDPTGILLAGVNNTVNGTANLLSAATLLESLVTEMDDRIAVLLAEGKDQQSVFTPKQPLILVVLEEAPGLLTAAESVNKELARRIQRAVTRLVQEGLKAGFRVVVLAQRFDASLLGGNVRANFGRRISFRADNGDAVKMLHSLVDEEAMSWLLRAQPGFGVVESPSVPPQRFRADKLDFDDYQRVVGGGAS